VAKSVIRCPGCETPVPVPAMKKAFRCPECGTTLRVHDPAEEAGDDEPDLRRLLSKVKLVERVPEGEGDEPPRRKKKRRDDPLDELDRPVRLRPSGSQAGRTVLAIVGLVVLVVGVIALVVYLIRNP
jgi:hypothetical protein